MTFVAVAAVGVGVGVAGAAYGAIAEGTEGNGPQFNDPTNQGLGVGDKTSDKGEQFADKLAPQYTQYNIDQQNQVTPGSSQTRELVNQQLQSYIQGYIPQDLQNKIQRQNAEALGGGFNFQTGGGQAPQNFARNLGITSLDLSKYGINAATAWQTLANNMVQNKAQLLDIGLKNYNNALDYQLKVNENDYTARLNQFKALRQAHQDEAGYIEGAGSTIEGFGESSAKKV